MFYLHLFSFSFSFILPFPFDCLTHVNMQRVDIIINIRKQILVLMICHRFDWWLWSQVFDWLFGFHNFVHFFLHLELKAIFLKEKGLNKKTLLHFNIGFLHIAVNGDAPNPVAFRSVIFLILGVPYRVIADPSKSNHCFITVSNSMSVFRFCLSYTILLIFLGKCAWSLYRDLYQSCIIA